MAHAETVAQAAIRLLDGAILSGSSHWQIMYEAMDEYPDGVWYSAVDGFLTDAGRFVTREEAGALVGCAEGEGFMAEGLWAVEEEDEDDAIDARDVGCACIGGINTPTLRAEDLFDAGPLAGLVDG